MQCQLVCIAQYLFINSAVKAVEKAKKMQQEENFVKIIFSQKFDSAVGRCLIFN